MCRKYHDTNYDVTNEFFFRFNYVCYLAFRQQPNSIDFINITVSHFLLLSRVLMFQRKMRRNKNNLKWKEEKKTLHLLHFICKQILSCFRRFCCCCCFRKKLIMKTFSLHEIDFETFFFSIYIQIMSTNCWWTLGLNESVLSCTSTCICFSTFGLLLSYSKRLWVNR